MRTMENQMTERTKLTLEQMTKIRKNLPDFLDRADKLLEEVQQAIRAARKFL